LHVHRMDIEQGNIITSGMVGRIHQGMTKSEVKDILGEPVLSNVFDPNRLDYVYTYKPGDGKSVEKYVTLIFRGDRLAEMRDNLYPEATH
jgi:outer membrane protein assembly factor BamE